MFVGVCRVTLHLPGNSSLKGKRRIIRSAVERTRGKFNASVAEVADNDNLKYAVIGATVVGNRAGHVDSMLAKIASFIEYLAIAPVVGLETEVIPMGDDIGIESGDALGGDRAFGEDKW